MTSQALLRESTGRLAPKALLANIQQAMLQRMRPE
jgi:hypothetical protein